MSEQRRLRFSLTELSGAVGDFGTILPLLLGVAVVCRLPLAPMLLFIGVWYIIAGFYYRLPVPIEPMKAIAVIAIAEALTAGTIAAAGILLGFIFLLFGFGTWMASLERWIPQSVIRGVQLGLALLLLRTTITFAMGDLGFFLLGTAVVIGFFLLHRFVHLPDLSAILIILLAIVAGIWIHGIPGWQFIPSLSIALPSLEIFPSAFTVLVVPQAFLTLSNAILATTLLLKDLFQEDVPARDLSRMIGAMNLVSVPLGGFPMCHGAGGLAAQYRFGARTGGSSIYAGAILILLALFFGGSEVLGIISSGFFGALLLFAALELARHGIKTEQYVITLCIAVLALVTGMTIAFLTGILLYYMWSIWRQESNSVR
jgi:hypothetical protein